MIVSKPLSLIIMIKLVRLGVFFAGFRSSKVQQLYYTELRQKVLRSQSHHQEALYFQLAAFALQAEVGDLEQREGSDEEERLERKHRHYFLPEDYFPSWVKSVVPLVLSSFIFVHLSNLLVIFSW